MVVSTLVVGTNTYVTRAEADTYLGDDFAAATLWAALTTSQRDQALLTAFKLLERQVWQGTAVGGVAFPREDLTDCAGLAVSSSTVPEDIESAQIELAYAISQDPSLTSKTSTADNTKSLKAGSAAIEFFNTSGDPLFVVGRFPANVMELIKCFLSSYGGSISGAETFGNECPETFDTDGFDRNSPF